MQTYRFDTSDGIHRDEKGELKDRGTEDEAIIVHGSFSFPGADGVVYTVKYTADENGFHPEGDHFTVPAFVPWVKGQPHDDGHYKHDHSDTYNRINRLPPTTVVQTSGSGNILTSLQNAPTTYIPPVSDNNEINIKATTRFVPVLKKRDSSSTEDKKTDSFGNVIAKDVNNLVQKTNK